MGERPFRNSLDRCDVKCGYEPGNCRWASYREQRMNMSTTRYLMIGGKVMTCKDWARAVGVKYSTFLDRLKRGWTPEKALEPTRRYGTR